MLAQSAVGVSYLEQAELGTGSDMAKHCEPRAQRTAQSPANTSLG